jgi:uncharacterized protein (TIGR00251 family)
VSAPDGRRPANDSSDAPPPRSGPRTSATDWLKSAPGGVSLLVSASPRASRTEVVGVVEGRLRVRLAAPPVEGAANEELVRFLSRSLGVPQSAVSVTAGAGGRRKTVLVRGVAAAAAQGLLAGHGHRA